MVLLLVIWVTCLLCCWCDLWFIVSICGFWFKRGYLLGLCCFIILFYCLFMFMIRCFDVTAVLGLFWLVVAFDRLCFSVVISFTLLDCLCFVLAVLTVRCNCLDLIWMWQDWLMRLVLLLVTCMFGYVILLFGFWLFVLRCVCVFDFALLFVCWVTGCLLTVSIYFCGVDLLLLVAWWYALTYFVLSLVVRLFVLYFCLLNDVGD